MGWAWVRVRLACGWIAASELLIKPVDRRREFNDGVVELRDIAALLVSSSSLVPLSAPTARAASAAPRVGPGPQIASRAWCPPVSG